MEQKLEAQINSLLPNVYLKWDRFLGEREESFASENDVDPLSVQFASKEIQAAYEKVVNAAAKDFLAQVESGEIVGFTDEELADEDDDSVAEDDDPDLEPEPEDR